MRIAGGAVHGIEREILFASCRRGVARARASGDSRGESAAAGAGGSFSAQGAAMRTGIDGEPRGIRNGDLLTGIGFATFVRGSRGRNQTGGFSGLQSSMYHDPPWRMRSHLCRSSTVSVLAESVIAMSAI